MTAPGVRRHLLVLAAVLAGRAPFLTLGYGSDEDAYRNVVAVLHTLQTGVYAPSRVPGFPLLDAVLAALVPLGAPAVVAATILAQATAAALLLRILEGEWVRSPLLLALVFALSPGYWTAATQAMDYAFGIAAILASYVALRGGRHALAGLLAGVAIGFRVTNGLVVPLGLVYLAMERRGARATGVFALAAAAAAALAYAPLLGLPEMAHLERHALAHAASHASAAAVPRLLWHVSMFHVGGPATLMILALGMGLLVRVAVRSPGGRTLPPPLSASLVFELGAVAGWCALYLLIPGELAYTLPALPFALLLLGRVADARVIALLALAVAVEAVVVRTKKDRRLYPGRVQTEMALRREAERTTDRLLERARAPRTIQVVGQPYVHRLLTRRAWRTAPGAWAAFESRGVVLWIPERRSGFADDFADSAAWKAAGYRVVVDSTGARFARLREAFNASARSRGSRRAAP